MAIKSIRIKNILSFRDFKLQNLADINCLIGKNNSGKSNLLKAIDFYYKSLNDEPVNNLNLLSSYSNHGEIEITFDTNRLEDVIRTKKENSSYQKHMYKTMFKSELSEWEYLYKKSDNKKQYTLTLKIHKNNSISWSNQDKDIREIIHRIYPFFSIDTRRIDLYDWKYLWNIITKLKFLNTSNLPREELISFIDSKISSKSNSYKEYVEKINDITDTSQYDYQEMLLNYIKVGLKGHTFLIDGFDLTKQSDGTNSYNFIEIFLHLVISLTRREFITPTVFIDEPEIGLHPKKAEQLIDSLHIIYSNFKSTSEKWEKGKYKTPNPKFIFSTHNPSILKTTVKLFNKKDEHKVYHLTCKKNKHHAVTSCSTMNSYFDDDRFVNVFDDNEAKLFFSNFILFVEGETELELFGNLSLKRIFPALNKIDVYKTNEVMLKAINPAKSNVAIPFLILYDADKMINVDLKNGAINFLSKEVDMFKIRNSLKYSFWGSKNAYLHKRLGSILKLNGVKNHLTDNKLAFKKRNISDLIEKINTILLEKECILLAPNTIEGFLISSRSQRIFIKWIKIEFLKNSAPGSKGDVNVIIEKYKNTILDKSNLERCFLSIFTGWNSSKEISQDNMIFAHKIRAMMLNHIVSKFKESQITKSERLIIFRMLLKGKSDTLCSIENNNYNYISKETKVLIKFLDKNVIKFIPSCNSKTGGWVSSFLNFSIEELRGTTTSPAELEKAFAFTFPQISRIIENVSSSID